ncbi:MAG: glycosyltransferase [Bdellovibrionales bacterium]
MQNASAPRISVIVPVRNSGATLRAALDSVFAQSFRSYEIIVVDGLSTDNTLDILKNLGEKVQWTSEKDSGTSDAINKGFKRASGDYITILLADDYFPDPQVFKRVIDKLDREPNIDMLFGSIRRIDPKGLAPTAEIPSSEHEMVKRISLQMPGAVFKRKALGGEELNASYKIANDYEFICRLYFDKKLKAAVVPDVNMAMHLGGMSGDTKNDFIKAYEKFRIRRRYFGLATAATFASGDYLISLLRRFHIRPFTWYRKTKRILSLANTTR